MLPFFSYTFFVLFILHPCTHARTPRDPLTALVAGARNDTRSSLSRFLDAGRGSQVTGMSELKRYFRRFGYLPTSDTNFTDTFDSGFESAVVMYQTKLGLPVTGKLDSNTITEIMRPRCGVTDMLPGAALHATSRFAYFYGKPRWVRPEPMKLTYAFSPKNMVDYLRVSEVRAVFRRSFSRWASVIPVSFSETSNYSSADIKIGFYRGDHGDGEPFDGVLGVLAHAFSPENGRFHLDAAEAWAVDFKTDRSRVAVDLESVATHEIGHVLGLGHSSVREAVMFPSLSPRTKKVELKIDDVAGVQSLYGSNPKFKFGSLLESAPASSRGVGFESRLSKWIMTVDLVLVVLILGLCT